jgi:hypothetical protein
MATIFEKLPASGEKCLILEPKEALVYPFNFGEWSDISLSMAVSLTSATDNNAFPTGEASLASTSPLSSFLIGLYSGDNFNLPCSANTSFVGIGNPTGYPFYITQGTGSINNRYSALHPNITTPNTDGSSSPKPLLSGFSSVNNDCIRTGFGGSSDLNDTRFFSLGTAFAGGSTTPSPFINGTLDTGYAKIITINFVAKNKGQQGQSFEIGSSNSSYTDVSIDKLNSLNLNLSNRFTGLYFNNTMNATGSPVSLPNKLLIYSPFRNSRLRIHSLLLTKN